MNAKLQIKLAIVQLVVGVCSGNKNPPILHRKQEWLLQCHHAAWFL